MKRWPATAVVAVAVSTFVGASSAACSLALDYTGIDDGVLDATSDVGGGIDATGDGPTAHDGSVDAIADGTAVDSPTGADASPIDAGPDGPCSAQQPPALVQVGTSCIDSTEVTVGQYTAFLTAKGGDTSGQPPECSAWNTSLVPSTWPQTGNEIPVAYANWCQAYMYCAWAGKRLCGAIGGGAGDPTMANDATQSEWFKACSHNNDGVHAYPYGNSYAPTLCNGADEGANGPLASRVTCVGGYPGLFDMSGNLYEWENSCGLPQDGAAPGPMDFCHVRGGGYSDNATNLRCDNGTLVNRSGPSPNVGFRCCAD